MTRSESWELSIWASVLIACTFILFTNATHDHDQQQVEARTEQAKAPLVPPLNESKMIEIYERAFYEANGQINRSVEQRHEFAMGAVQTAASRYHQLNQEIAKYDAP